MKYYLKLLVLCSTIICSACSAATPKEVKFYSELFNTSEQLSSSDIELIVRFNSINSEWNQVCLPIVADMVKVRENRMDVRTWALNHRSTLLEMQRVISNLRLTAPAIQNKQARGFSEGIVEINAQAASAYSEMVYGVISSDAPAVESGENNLRNISLRKQAYLVDYSNRYRRLIGDKNYDDIVGGLQREQIRTMSK